MIRVRPVIRLAAYLACLLVASISGKAHGTCVVTDPPGPGWVDLATFVDSCPDSEITIEVNLTTAICSRTVYGGDVTTAVNKTITITPDTGEPTLCITPSPFSTSSGSLELGGSSSNITFETDHGSFRFVGSSSHSALLIDDTTGHRFAGRSGDTSTPLWISFTGGTPAGVELRGAAEAEFETAFIDLSDLGILAEDTSESVFLQTALVENTRMGRVTDTAILNIGRLGFEPSVFTQNEDGFVADTTGRLNIYDSIFNTNFVSTPPVGVYRRMLKASDDARVTLVNTAAYGNGDPATHRAIGFDLTGDAVGTVKTSTWADNEFELAFNFLTTGTGTLTVSDSIIFRSGVPYSCTSGPTIITQDSTDLYPNQSPLPTCVSGTNYSFDPTFVTTGLGTGAVLTDDEVYLIDTSVVASVQDAGGASANFGPGDWTVFDWSGTPIREEECTTNDLGYHNYCPTCGATSCP